MDTASYKHAITDLDGKANGDAFRDADPDPICHPNVDAASNGYAIADTHQNSITYTYVDGDRHGVTHSDLDSSAHLDTKPDLHPIADPY